MIKLAVKTTTRTVGLSERQREVLIKHGRMLVVGEIGTAAARITADGWEKDARSASNGIHGPDFLISAIGVMASLARNEPPEKAIEYMTDDIHTSVMHQVAIVVGQYSINGRAFEKWYTEKQASMHLIRKMPVEFRVED